MKKVVLKRKHKPVRSINVDKTIAVSKEKSQFAQTEAFRQLRTNIEYASYEKDIKVVNIVSANASEGKSTVAANLALISTAKYDKVLLIDCDLRKPRQHKIFKVSNREGLTDIVKKDADILDSEYFTKVHYEDFEGSLYLLTSGMSIPNPQKMLGSERFGRLLEKCKEVFDFIIIDCPPIHAVADAIPISNVCDGTVFVLSAKDTDKHSAKSALELLQRANANILGTVLNRTDGKEGYYYRGY